MKDVRKVRCGKNNIKHPNQCMTYQNINPIAIDLLNLV